MGMGILMTVAVDDLVQVKTFGSYLGVETLNVYYYRVDSLGPTPETAYADVADWFENTVIPAIAAWQINFFVWTKIEIENLSNGIDVFTRSINIPGSNVQTIDQAVPSFVTFGWKILRASRVTRHGYKRFSGLLEQQVSGNDPGLTQAEIDAVSAVISSGFDASGTNFQDIIVKRPLPLPGQPYQYSFTNGAEFRGLGTQNTRKP